jgi:hypothetical protein
LRVDVRGDAVSARKRKAAKLSRRRLAEKYVAVVRGRSFGAKRTRTEVVEGRGKRDTMRRGKAIAGLDMHYGATVTLRANSKRGGVIERVMLAPTTRANGYVWRQAFET